MSGDDSQDHGFYRDLRPTAAPPLGYIDELVVGFRAELGSATVDLDAIVRFAGIFDPFSFHLDDDKARVSYFEGIIGSGLQTLSIAHLLAVTSGFSAEEVIVGGAGLDDVRFHAPVRPGDTLSVDAEIIAIVPPRAGKNHGIAQVAYRVQNGRQQTVLTFIDNQVIRTRPSSPG